MLVQVLPQLASGIGKIYVRMKVLFVASGNKAVGSVSAFVQSQFDSLKKQGLDMIMYPVKGTGWKGYAKNIRVLRKLIKAEKPDIVHAHYSTCGHLAVIASMGLKTKIVVSILGSFPRKSRKLKIVRYCIDHIWDGVIVKSERTRSQLDRKVPVIPNGVDLRMFNIKPQDEARKIVGFEDCKKYVIFVSNPDRSEKNYPLAKEAVELLHNKTVEIVPVYNKTHEQVVDYMCAADMLIMTSVSEGSPNVIKEAMACNCPIVVTDVGDVRWVTKGVEGTFVADSFDAKELSACVRKLLDFGRTKGRDQILRLGLNAESIAQKIINVYKNVL